MLLNAKFNVGNFLRTFNDRDFINDLNIDINDTVETYRQTLLDLIVEMDGHNPNQLENINRLVSLIRINHNNLS